MDQPTGTYQLKVKGTEYNQIDGTQDWGKVISRDTNDRIFRTKGDFTFKGWEDIYELIYGSTVNNGACVALEGRVYFREDKSSPYTEWWRGEIKPQDFQFDLIKESLEGQILDDVWAAKFANSDSQKVFLRSTLSKNGTFIGECVNALANFFDPTDPVLANYDVDDRLVFRMFDVFTFLVAYQTDGNATFVSDFFDIGGDGEQYYITTGQEIRMGDNAANPEVSFAETFEEANKKRNLWIIIELDDLDNPVVRIEPQGYVFENTPTIEVEDPEGIVMQIELDLLYTRIKVGSDAVDYDPSDFADYPNIRFDSWNEEDYNTEGDCQFENNVLDLVSNWKIDTNSIQQTLPAPNGASEDFDDNIFILEIDPSTLEAIKYTTPLTSSDTVEYIYNFNLTNSEVITAWFDGIPSQITKQLFGGVDVYVDTFAASPVTTEYQDLIFTNDSVSPARDPQDVYTTPAESIPDQGEFFAYVGAYYETFGSVNVDPQIGENTYSLVATVYEDNTRATIISETTLASATLRPFGFPGYAGITTISGSQDIFMFDTNVMVLRVKMRFTGIFTYDIISSYATVTTPELTYPIATNNPLIYLYDIARFYLPLEDFNTIEQNLGYVKFIDTKTSRHWNLWAKEMKYNPITQIAQGEFIGGTPITTPCWVLEEGIWNDNCSWDDGEIWIDPELFQFIMTVKTDNIGSSNNNQFTIPTTGGGYSFDVDWGDNVFTTGETGTVTHTYSVAGTYVVKVSGTFPRIYFNVTGDRLKVLSIDQWGPIAWTSMEGAFYGCENMVANYTDTPDLSGVTDCSFMFRNCGSFTSGVGNWDMSTIVNMRQMFRDSPLFDEDLSNWDTSSATNMNNLFMNGDIALGVNSLFNNGGVPGINNWDTSSVTTMISTFYGCNNFNQPVGSWDVSNVTDMGTMFFRAYNFDQNIGAWDVSNVTTFASFIIGFALSTANYDLLLTGWTGWSGGVPTKAVQNTLTFDVGTSTYSLATDAALARAYLVGTETWTINDGGGV